MARPRRPKPFSTIPLAPAASPAADPVAAPAPAHEAPKRATSPPDHRPAAAAGDVEGAAVARAAIGAPAFEEIRQLTIAAMAKQIDAQIGLASRLARATTLADAIAVQTAYARQQYECATTQWKDFSRAAQRWMAAWSAPAQAPHQDKTAAD